jgi:uncharacterized repeat protein (TIGR03803 family)
LTAAVLALCLAAGASAQTYTVLHEFGDPEDAIGMSPEKGVVDGESPVGGVVSDGVKLFGITEQGGAEDGGIIYSMNLDGSGYVILHSFDEFDYPTAGLALANGVLYGTTERGGTADMGMIYSINTDGSTKAGAPPSFTVLYNFPAGAWGYLYPSPLIVSEGTLYGQLMRDPADPDPDKWGIVYSIRTDGTGYTVLTSFLGSPEDGEEPWGRLLLEDGILYGATMYGGKYYVDAGTLFSLPVGGGTHTNLHDFSGTDGYQPTGGLVSDGSRLYGSTSSYEGFADSTGRRGVGFGYGTTGTVFAVDKNGANFTTLHTFDTDTTVASPGKGTSLYDYLGTGLARDGNTLYGTTFSVAIATMAKSSLPIDMGTIFAMNTDGTGYTELYHFDGIIDGAGSGPVGTLRIQNGTLYGTTLGGGANNVGVVYAYSIPPTPPIDVTANKTVFFTTDWLAIRANISVISTPCIPFVRIILPSGEALYCVQGQGLTSIPTPFLGSLTPVTVSAPITDYPILDGQFSAAAGTYYLEGGAIDATQTIDLNNPVYVGTVDRETLIVQ